MAMSMHIIIDKAMAMQYMASTWPWSPRGGRSRSHHGGRLLAVQTTCAIIPLEHICAGRHAGGAVECWGQLCTGPTISYQVRICMRLAYFWDAFVGDSPISDAAFVRCLFFVFMFLVASCSGGPSSAWPHTPVPRLAPLIWGFVNLKGVEIGQPLLRFFRLLFVQEVS